MDHQTFNTFREIVYVNSGIALNDTKEAMVSARIAKRMRAIGIETHEQYLQFLLQEESGNEITHFLDVISTNVTSFFREPSHFEFLAKNVENWIAKGKDRIRIWCAAASTGEEPYSIAMTLLDAAGGRNVDMRILATDISTSALSRAKKGMYSSSALEGVPELYKRRFFVRQKQNNEIVYTVADVLKNIIVFRRLNLSKPPFPMTGRLDIVFCRNVMIYFDNSVRSRLVNEIHRLLVPSGYLLTGHAEGLTSVKTELRCLEPSIYQKQ
ncbi:MAG: methyltransferase domain-containing protein [Deltaproteobacteria bacterium]|nr:methyltransferase domain-containing protein [Deltaproteobacteria bacterium]